MGFTGSFLHNIKDTIPPSEVCLYSSIIWNVAKIEQQPLLGLSQSLTSVTGSKAKTGFQLMFKWFCIRFQ